MKSFNEFINESSPIDEQIDTYIVKFKMRDTKGKLDQAFTIPASDEISAAQKAIFSFLRNNYGPSINRRDIEKKIASEDDLDKMKISVTKK